MDQSDWSGLGAMGVLAAAFVAALCAVVVGVPIAVYRVAARKNRPSWDAPLHVRAAGAYRAAPLEVNGPGRIPRIVAAASLVSLLAASVTGTVQLLVIVQVPPHEVTLRDLAVLATAFASGVVGAILTRRSYVVAAFAGAFAACELALGADLALRERALAAPLVLAAHAALLLSAVAAHLRATLRACA